MTPLRIIFMGTGDVACPSLHALVAARYEIAAVVTQPDRPAGRNLRLQSSPVKQQALAGKFPLLQPARARDHEFVQALTRLKPELIIVVAYGQILPEPILTLPRLGCLNVHTSLLPRYRGAAPIQWAILNDDSETGVTIMKMDAGVDTGDIVAQSVTPIHPGDDFASLRDRLAGLGAELLVQTIPDYASGRIHGRRQPSGGASHARKITKSDGQVDWTQPARKIWNQVRALNPWPGAFTFHSSAGKARMIKIWRADIAQAAPTKPGAILEAGATGIIVSCGGGSVRVLELQQEGARRLSAREFLAGNAMRAGEQWGTPRLEGSM